MMSIGALKRFRVMACARVNSRNPSAPWMRPKPESPTPPNGSDGTPAKVSTELTLVIPARSCEAISMARFLAKTADARP
jgi:hypothetical protein